MPRSLVRRPQIPLSFVRTLTCSPLSLPNRSHLFNFDSELATTTVLRFGPPPVRRPRSALNDSSYRETIESSSNYNNRLVVERKTRIPFIDSQTGLCLAAEGSACSRLTNRTDRLSRCCSERLLSVDAEMGANAGHHRGTALFISSQ